MSLRLFSKWRTEGEKPLWKTLGETSVTKEGRTSHPGKRRGSAGDGRGQHAPWQTAGPRAALCSVLPPPATRTPARETERAQTLWSGYTASTLEFPRHLSQVSALGADCDFEPFWRIDQQLSKLKAATQKTKH